MKLAQAIQYEYEADGGVPGMVIEGKVWREIAVSCDCGVSHSELVADEPSEDIHYFATIKRLRTEWQRCETCGKAYEIGLSGQR